MKSLPLLLNKVYCEPWLITADKHRAIQSAIESHLSGDVRMDAADGDGPDRNKPDPAPYDIDLNGTALIRVSGILGKRLSMIETMCGGYDVDDLVETIEAAEHDPMCQRILIDFDTPGGVATGIPEAASVISESSKPIIGYCEMICASAGYWLASQCSSFFTSASAQVGSIGAYAAYLDRSKQLAESGVKINPVVSGKYKLAGAPFKPMTDDEREMLQSHITKLHDQFKAAVRNSRPDVRMDAMEGQMFDGESAVEAGLSDGIVSSLSNLRAIIVSYV